MTSRITGPAGPVVPQITTPSTPAAPTTPTPAAPSKPTGWQPKQLADPEVAKKHRDQATWAPTSGSLFVNGVAPDDALQGALGNCYLVSGLASLAQVQPEVIQNAIRDNGDGTFTVKFHKDSLLGLFPRGHDTMEVTVDGDIPTKDGKKPLYTRGRDANELWPMLIEKAYAKLDGGYQRVGVGGAPTTIWQALTGKRGQLTPHLTEGSNSLWKKINNALNEKRPVAATTTLGNVGDSGLSKGHVYSVLGVSEKDGQRLVTVRNPWGHTEVGNDGKNDGTFTMPIEDFKKRFGMTFFGG